MKNKSMFEEYARSEIRLALLVHGYAMSTAPHTHTKVFDLLVTKKEDIFGVKFYSKKSKTTKSPVSKPFFGIQLPIYSVYLDDENESILMDKKIRKMLPKSLREKSQATEVSKE